MKRRIGRRLPMRSFMVTAMSTRRGGGVFPKYMAIGPDWMCLQARTCDHALHVVVAEFDVDPAEIKQLTKAHAPSARMAFPNDVAKWMSKTPIPRIKTRCSDGYRPSQGTHKAYPPCGLDSVRRFDLSPFRHSAVS